MNPCKIVVSLTHLKNIIALAENNAMSNPDLSPMVEIELVEKRHPCEFEKADSIKITQLPYSVNATPVLIGI